MPRLCLVLIIAILAPRLAGASDISVPSATKLAAVDERPASEPREADWTDPDARWADDKRDNDYADTPYWYGWQSLLASLGAVGLGVGGLLGQEEWLIYPAIALFFAAPTAVHLLHGEYPEALASFLLRTVGVIGFAAAGLFIGALQDGEGSDGLEAFQGLIYGAAVGLFVVTVADVAFLSTKERAPPPAWAVGGGYDGDRAQLSLTLRF